MTKGKPGRELRKVIWPPSAVQHIIEKKKENPRISSTQLVDILTEAPYNMQADLQVHDILSKIKQLRKEGQLPLKDDAWPPEVLARLKAMYMQGGTNADIGKALGKCGAVISRKLKALREAGDPDILETKSHPWTDEEVVRMCQLLKCHTVAAVAATLNRPKWSVTNKVTQLREMGHPDVPMSRRTHAEKLNGSGDAGLAEQANDDSGSGISGEQQQQNADEQQQQQHAIGVEASSSYQPAVVSDAAMGEVQATLVASDAVMEGVEVPLVASEAAAGLVGEPSVAPQAAASVVDVPADVPGGSCQATQELKASGAVASTQKPPVIGAGASSQSPLVIGAGASTQSPLVIAAGGSSQLPPVIGAGASTPVPPVIGAVGDSAEAQHMEDDGAASFPDGPAYAGESGGGISGGGAAACGSIAALRSSDCAVQDAALHVSPACMDEIEPESGPAAEAAACAGLSSTNVSASLSAHPTELGADSKIQDTDQQVLKAAAEVSGHAVRNCFPVEGMLS